MSLAVKQGLIASSDSRVIVGLGVTGLSCARFLHRSGLAFAVVDTRSEPPGLAEFEREFPDVPVFFGDVPDAVIESASELIVSPGVALDDPVVVTATAAGAVVVGDIDLFAREAKAPVIGITGSNAKSTVTELVGQMAREAGVAVAVGGNLGVPALELLSDDCELYVLELSSFQLERAGQLNLSLATVLNLSVDHMDRHGSMPLYHRAKHRIFGGCGKVVVNRDDSLTAPLVAEDVEVISWRMGEPDLRGFGLRVEDGREYFSHNFELLLPVEELQLPGRHNVANALAALSIGYGAGLPIPSMLNTLRNFRGLPHRCEVVAKVDGVTYVNDSKGTNVGATEAALNGLGVNKNILLIAGGQGKGADFDQLRSAVGDHCKMVLLIGEASLEMQQCFDGAAPVVLASTLAEAVSVAAGEANSGDCVLLSPACASFDMFAGYAERGDVFVSAVSTLSGESS